jgi:Ca2+-binding EF-hand superfamily protein
MSGLLRRLDRDGDGRIGYTEFIQVVTPASQVYGSENNFSSVFSFNSLNSEPSPRPCKGRKSKSLIKKGKNSQLQKFARFLMQQIMLEKELEAKRMELSLRVDFSIGKLFRMVDRMGKGSVNIKDVDDAMRTLGIVPELNQCHLLFRNYDRDHDNCLDFWDFCEIFNPRNKIYADLILHRVSEIKEEFSVETVDLITDTFIVLLNIQTVTEELKVKLFRKNFDLQNLFQKLDINGLGFLTRGCFRNLLRQYKFYATERDLEAILMVYDANKEGKIGYSKFVQGVCPRQ